MLDFRGINLRGVDLKGIDLSVVLLGTESFSGGIIPPEPEPDIADALLLEGGSPLLLENGSYLRLETEVKA